MVRYSRCRLMKGSTQQARPAQTEKWEVNNLCVFTVKWSEASWWSKWLILTVFLPDEEEMEAKILMNKTVYIKWVLLEYAKGVRLPFPFHDKLSHLSSPWSSLGFPSGQGRFRRDMSKPSQTTTPTNNQGHPERAARVCKLNILLPPISTAWRRGLGHCFINSDTGGEEFQWLTVIESAIQWFVSTLWHNWLAIRKLGRGYWITIQKDWLSVSTGFHISFICLPTCLSLFGIYWPFSIMQLADMVASPVFIPYSISMVK